MPPEKSRRKLALEWLGFASRDLIAAERVTRDDDRCLDFACFHCQQAAEKALKAFLVWNDIRFPKTHDLVVLGGLCPTHDPELNRSILDVADLTRYAVDSRYPGEHGDPVTRDEATEAFEKAQCLYSLVLKAMN